MASTMAHLGPWRRRRRLERLCFSLSTLACLIDPIGAQQLRHVSTKPPKNTPTNLTADFSVDLELVSGTLHVAVEVGQPPQRRLLIVDTGSKLAAWTCADCRHCGGQTRYDPQASTTLVPTQCGDCRLSPRSNGHCTAPSSQSPHCLVTQRYSEGSSWTGVEMNDLVIVGGANDVQRVVHLDFVCQSFVDGLFRKQHADGILGMQRSEHSLVGALYDQGVLTRRAFALCVGRDRGRLGMGGAHVERHLEQMRTTPMVRDNGLYFVEVLRVRLGQHCIACDGPESKLYQALNRGKGTLLDSGTTDTFLPRALHDEFVAAWEAETGASQPARRHHYSYEEFRRLPTLWLELAGNVTLDIPPLHYMQGALDEPWLRRRALTNRLYVDEPEGAVLGLNAMRGYDILYGDDWIGLAKADCQGDGITSVE